MNLIAQGEFNVLVNLILLPTYKWHYARSYQAEIWYNLWWPWEVS